MTAHVHDPAADGGGTHPEATPAARGPAISPRPRWLLPGLLVMIVVGALVVAGVVSPSTVLYAGLFGGMILMHAGGHGHGGHGGHGGGRDGSGVATTNDAEDLRQRSPGSQPAQSGSSRGLDERASKNPMTSESKDHDQHGSHGCH